MSTNVPDIVISAPCVFADDFIALVRPVLEYRTLIWDPYLKKDISNIEKVSCQAAQFEMGPSQN